MELEVLKDTLRDDNAVISLSEANLKGLNIAINRLERVFNKVFDTAKDIEEL